jgi:alkaline phosphatase D
VSQLNNVEIDTLIKLNSYDPTTGRGATGVEFAVTGVTSTTGLFSGDFDHATNVSTTLVTDNTDLQWSEGFYRGFLMLEVSPKSLNATYYSMRNVSEYLQESFLYRELLICAQLLFKAFRNLDGFAAASFIVKPGDNRLDRPVAGGRILSGALKSQVVH